MNRDPALRKVIATGMALTGVLAVAGCSSGKSVPASSSATTAEAAPISGSPERTVGFKFDWLGGGSKVTMVYPGVESTAADEQYDGTFEDGQTGEAVCQTTGRTVHSDTSVGERPLTSNKWVGLQPPSGQSSPTQFATEVYINSGDIAQLNTLPAC